jgi:hypothetical protein
MNAQQLIDTARALVAGVKGLLAMDEYANLQQTVRQVRDSPDCGGPAGLP